MLECVVLMFIVGYNPHTTESKQLYRCEGERHFRYLDNDDKVHGRYSIEHNVIILEERYGL